MRQAGRQTVIDADVGYRGLTVNELRFASSTPAFDRPVEVSGSMDGKAFFWPAAAASTASARRARHAPAQQPVPVPADPDLERRRRAAARPPRDAARVPRLHPARSGFTPPFRVLYGGPAVRPEYDFAQQPEVRGQPALALLGPEHRNEAFEPPADTRPIRRTASRADQGRARAGGGCPRRRGLLRPATPYCGIATRPRGGPCARREPAGSRSRRAARPRTGSRRAGAARVRSRLCARAAGGLVLRVPRGHLASHISACHGDKYQKGENLSQLPTSNLRNRALPCVCACTAVDTRCVGCRRLRGGTARAAAPSPSTSSDAVGRKSRCALRRGLDAAGRHRRTELRGGRAGARAGLPQAGLEPARVVRARERERRPDRLRRAGEAGRRALRGRLVPRAAAR